MCPLWNQQLLRGFDRGCCCGSIEAQKLGLLVVGHPWGDDCLQLPNPLGFFGFAVDDDGLRGMACLRYYCCSRLRSGAMKRGQGILPLELFDSMSCEVYDVLHLRVLWHLHEA